MTSNAKITRSSTSDEQATDSSSIIPSLIWRSLSLFSLQSYERVFIAVAVIAFLAKGQAFLNPVPSVDDWARIASWGVPPLTGVLHHQRYLDALLFWLRWPLGFGTIATSFSTVALALIMSVAIAIAAMRAICPSAPPGWPLVLGATIFAIHPNFAEIFTFTEVTLDVTLSAALGVAAILFGYQRPLRSGLICSILVFLSLSIYQISINIIAVILAMRLIYSLISRDEFQPAIRSSIFVAVGIFIYAFSVLISVKVLGVPTGRRGTLMTITQIPEHFIMLLNAIELAFLPRWVQFPASGCALFAAAISLLVMLARATKGRWYTLPLIGILLIAAIVSTVGVAILGKVPWIVPRVLIAAGALLGGIVVLGLTCARAPTPRILIGVSGTIACLGYLALNNTVFYESQKLYLWDTTLMNRIISKMEMLPEYDQIQTVVFSGVPSDRPRLKTAYKDLQRTAIAPPWSQAALFEQGAGKRLKRPPTQRERLISYKSCRDMGNYWPANGSVFITNGVGVICFGPR